MTGQAIGIGGDRLSLWSHPTEIRSAFHDGGWSADAIAEAFESTVAEVPETYGIPAPKLPELEPQERLSDGRALRARARRRGARLRSTCTRTPRPTGAATTRCPRSCAPGADKYFGVDGGGPPTLDQLAAYYRERKMAAVVFTVDAESALGHTRIANEEVIEGARRNADVLLPFASIDPAKGRAGVTEARRLVEELGVRGFKFHPSVQAFHPNDPSVYPLYEVLEELGVPALFHSGQTGIGSGLPGGGGIRLKYSNPLHLDDVAVDFPDLTIIIAHPSFPWQDEALAVASHKPKVYIDLSGWSPKYFPPQLVKYANSLLKHKVLFGSDFPLISPDRWLADFETLDIKDEVRPLILKENALTALGLRGPARGRHRERSRHRQLAGPSGADEPRDGRARHRRRVADVRRARRAGRGDRRPPARAGVSRPASGWPTWGPTASTPSSASSPPPGWAASSSRSTPGWPRPRSATCCRTAAACVLVHGPECAELVARRRPRARTGSSTSSPSRTSAQATAGVTGAGAAGPTTSSTSTTRR